MKSPSGRKRTVRTEEKRRTLRLSVKKSPTRSTRHRSQVHGIAKTTLLLMTREAKLKPYKLTTHHQLTETDKQKRAEMAQCSKDNPEVLDKIWFSDESHLWPCGHVNSHKAVHWGEERPNEMLQKPLQSKKIAEWVAMRKDQPLVGPSFFEGEEEEPITITAERYVTLTLTPFLQAMQRIPGFEEEEHWLQQDGAAPHTARSPLAWLRQHFAGRLISLKTDLPWVPHSPDL